MSLSDYLVTDDLTVILALAAAGLFLLHNLYKPQSLVHPILLGRQSDAARVRHPGESAVFRNYGTGMMGRFPVRPAKEQQVILDLIKPDQDSPRTLWKTKLTNPELRRRVSALGTGLIKVAGLVPEDSNVLLLLNDGLEFIIADLALASHAIPSFTLTSMSLLSTVLENHPPSAIITEAEFLPQLLELIYDSHESSHHTIIVVGEPAAKYNQGLNQIHVIKFAELERQGAQVEPVASVPTDPLQIFTVSFYQTPTGQLRGAQFTHESITAGVTAIRSLMPSSGPLSALDTVVSAHSLSSAYGRAVAYTALFEGANFATLSSSKLVGTENGPPLDLADTKSAEVYPIPSTTILFVTPSHLTALATAINDKARNSSFLSYSLAWRHKLSGVLEGFFTKQSLWDRLVFDGARVEVMGKGAGTVRSVIVSGGTIENQALTPARVALSVPILIVHSHPQVSGPVLATHAFDVQSFPNETASPGTSAADNYAFSYLSAVGAPSINLEAKLIAVDDASIEAGEDPVGRLMVRGPSVGVLLDVELKEGELEKGWFETGEKAKVLPNGTFKVVPPSK